MCACLHKTEEDLDLEDQLEAMHNAKAVAKLIDALRLCVETLEHYPQSGAKALAAAYAALAEYEVK